MKQTLSFLALTAMILLSFASCTKSNVETIEDKIVGKWQITTAIGDYTVYGVNRKDTTHFTADNYFQFNADGTVNIRETEVDYSGKWKITGNKLVFTETQYMEYGDGFELTILTQNDLQLYYTETNSFSTLEQKLNLSR